MEVRVPPDILESPQRVLFLSTECMLSCVRTQALRHTEKKKKKKTHPIQLKMVIVYIDEMRCAYVHDRVYLGSVELDFERLLLDPQYLDQAVPCGEPSSAVVHYVMKTLPYIDDGVYVLQTTPLRTTNVMSGTSTETDEFGELFSFQRLLRRLLF